jgi:hypothetical protein
VEGWSKVSFLSILKKIGSVTLGVEHIAAPLASVLYPPDAPFIAEYQPKLDAIFARVPAAIIAVEQNNPTDGQGKVKEASVINDFVVGLDATQSILAITNKQLTFDEVALKAAIAAQVEAFNQFAKVRASFKVVDLPTPPAQ